MNKFNAARRRDTSPDVLTQLSTDSSHYVRQGVAENPNTPGHVLAVLIDDDGPYVRPGLARNPSTPAPTLVELAGDSDWSIRKAVASNPNTPSRVLITLSTDEDWNVRNGAASNPKTPSKTLVTLAADAQDYVRQTVAENSCTPIRVLSVLASDTSWIIRSVVASSPRASVDVLTTFATGESDWIRATALANPALPVALLGELAANANESIRKSVAESPRVAECPPAMELLARDPKSKVRVALAKNANVPEWILEVLAGDKLKSVRDAVMRNPSAPIAAKEQKPMTAREHAAFVLAQDLTIQEIDGLGQNKYQAVQVAAIVRGCELGLIPYDEALAAIDNYSRSVISQLLNDVVDSWNRSLSSELYKLLLELYPDEHFASAVSSGRCTEESRLLVLAKSRLPRTCWAVATSESLTEPLLRALIDAPASSDSTDGEDCSSLVGPGVIWAGDYLRRIPQVIVALHPDTPADLFEQLARARSKYVRAAMASREDLPQQLRATLAKDKQSVVRASCARWDNCSVEELARFAVDRDVEVRRAAHDHARATEEVKATAALMGL